MYTLLDINAFVLFVSLSCSNMMCYTVFAQATSGRSCRWNQITILKPKGAECFDCAECPEGHGLVPQCGSRITADVTVECVPCQKGEGYSDKHDISSCKPCTICDPNEETISPCTATKNAVCGKCKAGYYRATTGDCHPCSWCCADSKDEDKEKQCSEQTSLPVNQVCRYDVNTIKCAPRTNSAAAQTPTKSAVRKLAGSGGAVGYDRGAEKENMALWLFVVYGLVALATCALIALLYICSRKKQFLSQPVWKTLCVRNRQPTQVVSLDSPRSQIVFGKKPNEGQMI